MTVASPTLNGNFLSAADSLFETGSPSWGNSANATAIAATTAQAFSGSHSLTFKATAAGNVEIGTAQYTTGIKANKGYVVSSYLMPGAARSAVVGISWFNSSGTFLSTTAGSSIACSAGVWNPLTARVTSPATAARAVVVVEVFGCAINEVSYLDCVFGTSPMAQVLIDWTNEAFGASATGGNAFADMTPFVKFDVGIDLSIGRTDNVNDIQPGSATFTLQNDNGWFTPFCNASPWYVAPPGDQYITLGRRCQVAEQDQVGSWHVRFDGPVSELDYTLDNTGNTNQCAVSATDILAYLNRQDALSCWTKEMVLSEPSLVYHWSLDDSGQTGLAAESSGNNGSPLQLRYWGTRPSDTVFTWAQGPGGIETLANAPVASQYAETGLSPLGPGPSSTPLQSPEWTPKTTAQAGHNYFRGTAGAGLAARIPGIQTNVSGGNTTIECWFMMDPALGADSTAELGPFTVIAFGESRSGYNFCAGLYTQASGNFQFRVVGYNQPPSFTGTAWGGTPVELWNITDSSWVGDNYGSPHHLVITIQGSPSSPVLTAYLDGTNLGNVTLSSHRTYDWITVGSAYGGYGSWYGGISLVSLYSSQLSSADITAHCNMGQYAMWEQTADATVWQLSQFTGIPSYWNGLTDTGYGLSPMEYMDITGSNALTAMQQYEAAEHGLLFVNNAGQLMFHTRDWRMGYGAPDLTLPEDSYDADLGFSLSDQYLVNQAGVSSEIFGTGYFSDNADSDSLYGDYSNGTADSPTSYPLLSYSRGYEQRGIGLTAYFTAPYMVDLADWQTNTSAQPYLKCEQVTVDLLTLDSHTGLTISQVLAIGIDNVVTLGVAPTHMPTDAGALDYFVEGINETISLSSRSVQFYTSPANRQRAWKPGDSTYGVLGSTARIGISSMDTHTLAPLSKYETYEPGPPYWPPTITTSMNNPIANGHDFLGENDIRGINDLAATKLNPPMFCVGQRNESQSVPSSGTGFGQVVWDWIYVDNMGGMGFVNGWPNWYCCLVPGYYDIDWSILWSIDNTGSGLRVARLVVAANAAQAVASGSGDPTTVNEVNIVDSEIRTQAVGKNDINAGSTRMYLGLGDMLTVSLWQNSGGAYQTGTNYSGGMLSGVWTGYSTVSDQNLYS